MPIIAALIGDFSQGNDFALILPDIGAICPFRAKGCYCVTNS